MTDVSGESNRARRCCAGFAPHLALLAAGALCAVVAALRHVPDDEAWRRALDPGAPADVRIGAIHRLANRAVARDPRLGEDLARALLASADERLREYALTTDLAKHHAGSPDAEPALQTVYALTHEFPYGAPHQVRSVLIHLRKVGGVPVGGRFRLTLDEVRWFLASLRGGPLPTAEELARHVAARDDEGGEPRGRVPQGDDL